MINNCAKHKHKNSPSGAYYILLMYTFNAHKKRKVLPKKKMTKSIKKLRNR